MKIEFSTRDYEWTYGKQPRGYGWWWFFFEGHEFQHGETYSEAKKACKEYVKQVAPKGYEKTVIVKVGT